MSKEKAIQLNKKALRSEITHQLEHALGKLKEQLGQKKFDSRLKKAVKLLTEDINTAKKGLSEKTKKAKDKTTSLTSTAKELKKEFQKGLEKTDKAQKRVIEPKKETVKADTVKPTTKTKK